MNREYSLYDRARNYAASSAPAFLKELRAASGRYSLAAFLLRAAGRDARLQKGILQFVSVLPVLKTTDEICDLYRQFVLPHAGALPLPFACAARLAALTPFRAFGMRAALWTIEKKIAPRFIIRDEQAFLRAKERYEKCGAGINVDFLGEDVLTFAEADDYLDYYIKAMRRFGGKDAPFNLSVKFSALYPFFSAENYEESRRVGGARFQALLRTANDTNSFLAVDAEQYARQRIVEDIFFDTLLLPEFRSLVNVKLATQAYTKNAMATAQRIVAFAKERGAPFYVRLVKGAYLETERALALQKGWASPVWDTKEETDESFARELAYLMAYWGKVFVSPATHNPESVLFAEAMARGFGIADDTRLVFEVLHGLGEPMLLTLRKRGHRVLVYLPCLKTGGNLLDGMGYFARRLEENTAGDNVLRALML